MWSPIYAMSHITYNIIVFPCPHVTFIRPWRHFLQFLWKGHVGFLQLLKWPRRTSFYFYSCGALTFEDSSTCMLYQRSEHFKRQLVWVALCCKPRIGSILNPLAGKFSEDTRTKGKGANLTTLGTPRQFSGKTSMLCIAKTTEEFRMISRLAELLSVCLSQYDWLKGSHMTKVVWLPNEIDRTANLWRQILHIRVALPKLQLTRSYFWVELIFIFAEACAWSLAGVTGVTVGSCWQIRTHLYPSQILCNRDAAYSTACYTRNDSGACIA